MRHRVASVPVVVQVALLALFSVVASQLVLFVVVLTAPPPQPAGFSVNAAADALMGRPAETTDGRALRRQLLPQPGLAEQPPDPLAAAIRFALAQRLQRPQDEVRVQLAAEPLRRSLAPDTWRRLDSGRPPAAAGSGDGGGPIRLTLPARTEGGPPGPDPDALADALGEALAQRQPPGTTARTAPDVTVQMVRPTDRQIRFTVLADRLTFAPFAASVRLEDGQWATVKPPRGLIDPWQARLLMALGITALLLTPVVWLMARRLARPIRAFADAAERLGANPDAEPLTPSGPTEVRTAIAAFNDMQASIRQHMRQRTQTIAAIAHDLRTPLTRLRFRAEQVPEALRDRMAADVEEMDALIGQALAFARGETRAERREVLNLSALAADCVLGFAETGASVTFAGEASLPIEGDPAALRRAVSNLIDNAVKFAGSAQVMAAEQGDLAVLTISDEGPGLAENELEAVFEPFYRGERSRNRQTGGAGLGLAIARQAVRAVGGEVVLSNRAAGGLEARLTLPLVR
ncbi:MAG: ATP-binding protein [Brevundimonas sp.]|uniref:ATP-binding protein n=1 Tax=Brevundimonas sp. TaxID=1871086 RepID=UPI0027323C03|nr:ATP-binding protein [Brevundimonas sp.]MDP3403213.1 ATP-binding protein [Brevundimonas sp.]